MQFYPTGGGPQQEEGSETPDRILDFKRFSGFFPSFGGIIHSQGELVNLPLFLSSLWGYWRESVP